MIGSTTEARHAQLPSCTRWEEQQQQQVQAHARCQPQHMRLPPVPAAPPQHSATTGRRAGAGSGARLQHLQLLHHTVCTMLPLNPPAFRCSSSCFLLPPLCRQARPNTCHALYLFSLSPAAVPCHCPACRTGRRPPPRPPPQPLYNARAQRAPLSSQPFSCPFEGACCACKRQHRLAASEGFFTQRRRLLTCQAAAHDLLRAHAGCTHGEAPPHSVPTAGILHYAAAAVRVLTRCKVAVLILVHTLSVPISHSCARRLRRNCRTSSISSELTL